MEKKNIKSSNHHPQVRFPFKKITISRYSPDFFGIIHECFKYHTLVISYSYIVLNYIMVIYNYSVTPTVFQHEKLALSCSIRWVQNPPSAHRIGFPESWTVDSLKTLFIPFGGLLKWQFDREASHRNGETERMVVDGEGWKCEEGTCRMGPHVFC